MTRPSPSHIAQAPARASYDFGYRGYGFRPAG